MTDPCNFWTGWGYLFVCCKGQCHCAVYSYLASLPVVNPQRTFWCRYLTALPRVWNGRYFLGFFLKEFCQCRHWLGLLWPLCMGIRGPTYSKDSADVG